MAPPKTFPTPNLEGLGAVQPPMVDPITKQPRPAYKPHRDRQPKPEKKAKTPTAAQRRKHQMMGNLLPPEIVPSPDGWSEKWSRMILRYKRAGLTNAQCSMLIGVSEDSLERYFPRELASGRLEVIVQVANKLLDKALEGDSACMMFYLKTQAGWRETNRTEVTGAEGMPIAAATITLDGRDLSPDQRVVLRTALEAAVNGKNK